jgi:hypothetical protein
MGCREGGDRSQSYHGRAWIAELPRGSEPEKITRGRDIVGIEFISNGNWFDGQYYYPSRVSGHHEIAPRDIATIYR